MGIQTMSRNIKRLMMDAIQLAVAGKSDLLVVDTSSVKGVSVNRMRVDFADRGITMLFVKNAVATRALIDLGIDCALQAFVGPSALVFGVDDIVTLSKQLRNCADMHKGFVIRSGIIEGRLLQCGEIVALSNSLTKPELLSQISGCLLAPGRVLASALSSNCSIASQIESLSIE